MGRDIPTRPRPCAPGHFNPRAPYGARPAAGAEKQSSLNFNPLARVGRDVRRRDPTCPTSYFNPRARVGRDMLRCFLPQAGIPFNPRARVGRDAFCILGIVFHHLFQSTRPRGARPCLWRWRGRAAGFQSTRPRGARPFGSYGSTPAKDFNPRARVGRDEGLLHGDFLQNISIHAPAWGATCCSSCSWPTAYHFNPRARVGRDDSYAVLRGFQHISIHAPAWGATNRRSASSPSV